MIMTGIFYSIQLFEETVGHINLLLCFTCVLISKLPKQSDKCKVLLSYKKRLTLKFTPQYSSKFKQ